MKNNLLDVVFPRFCLGCGYVGAYVCERCEGLMSRTPAHTCFYCKKNSLLGLTHPKCKRKYGIDGHIFLYKYKGFLIKIIQEAKYHGAEEVLRELLRFPQKQTHSTLHRWKRLFNPTIITVPLHPNRERERGFNQSQILTQATFPYKTWEQAECLERTVNTPQLAQLKETSKRKASIRGAFIYREGAPPPKKTLLVDDVVTSGSTIEECSVVLKKQGVQTVLAFSLAKG